MLKNILFAILLLLSGILGAGGIIVIANSDDSIGFIIGMVIIFLWIGTCAILESKYFIKQQKAWLKFFGLTANEE